MKNGIVETETTSIIKRIRADIDTGLTSEQVAQRKDEGMDNKPVESPSKTANEIVKDNVFTYFNMLFAVLSILLIAVGSYRDLTFMPIIIDNTGASL